MMSACARDKNGWVSLKLRSRCEFTIDERRSLQSTKREFTSPDQHFTPNRKPYLDVVVTDESVLDVMRMATSTL